MTKEEIKAQAKQKLGIKLTKERRLSEEELYQLHLPSVKNRWMA